jgi:hypothetical protein
MLPPDVATGVFAGFVCGMLAATGLRGSFARNLADAWGGWLYVGLPEMGRTIETLIAMGAWVGFFVWLSAGNEKLMRSVGLFIFGETPLQHPLRAICRVLSLLFLLFFLAAVFVPACGC